MSQDGYRPISLDGRAVQRTHTEDQPPLEWLPIDRIVIDDAFQRPLGRANWKAIEGIARAFTWARFLPVLAAPTVDGRFSLIDGQHRTHAALLRGYTAVPAMVVRMSLAEQAAAFASVNGDTVKITLFHVYKAALAARESWAVSCADAVQAGGCQLMTFNKSAAQKQPGEVYAIALIRSLIADGCADVVTKGLGALRRSESGDDPWLYTSKMLAPWLSALASNQLFLAIDLAGFLDAFDLAVIADNLDLRRKAEGDRRPHAPQLRLEIQRALTDYRSRTA